MSDSREQTTAQRLADEALRRVSEPTPPRVESESPPPPPPSPWAAAVALIADLREAFRGRVKLFSLELKQAAGALGQMVALGLLAAFMAHAAWFAIVIGLTWAAIDAGAPWWVAFIVVVLIHLGIAAWAGLRLMRLARLLSMPATMRHLVGKSREATPSSTPAGVRTD